METQRLSAREIRGAIRRLPDDEREQLLDDLFAEVVTETPEELAAVAEGLDQAERGELIAHEDLAGYMAARRKERQRGQQQT